MIFCGNTGLFCRNVGLMNRMNRCSLALCFLAFVCVHVCTGECVCVSRVATAAQRQLLTGLLTASQQPLTNGCAHVKVLPWHGAPPLPLPRVLSVCLCMWSWCLSVCVSSMFLCSLGSLSESEETLSSDSDREPREQRKVLFLESPLSLNRRRESPFFLSLHTLPFSLCMCSIYTLCVKKEDI